MSILRIVRFVLGFTLSCSFSHLYSEGFCAGILVKTSTGYVSIEHIDCTDVVVASSYCVCHVIQNNKYCVDRYIKIGVGDVYLHVTCDQKLYTHKDGWVLAKDLQLSHTLMGYGGSVIPIATIEIIHEHKDVYALSIESPHTYCVSDKNIIVHNMAPVIGIGISFLIGSGTIEFAGITISAGLVVLGSYFGINAYQKKKHAIEFKPVINGSDIGGSCGGSPQDPKKDDEDHPYGIYRGAKYHHKNSVGRKSPAPHNGQKVLDESLSIEGNTRRVGLEDGKVVIFDQTLPGEYHAHLRTIEELKCGGDTLSQRIYNTLVNAKLITRSGKIIK